MHACDSVPKGDVARTYGSIELVESFPRIFERHAFRKTAGFEVSRKRTENRRTSCSGRKRIFVRRDARNLQRLRKTQRKNVYQGEALTEH